MDAKMKSVNFILQALGSHRTCTHYKKKGPERIAGKLQ